jgi:hypothetical protein
VTTVVLVLLVPVSVLCVVNLAFSLAVIRRLREHTETLATLNEIVVPPDSGLAPGTSVPPGLLATTEAGLDVGSDTLVSGEKLLAFVSASCLACRRHLPAFVAAVRSGHREADTVVVVSGDRRQGADLVEQVGRAAHVVVEDDNGPWTIGFDVSAFPTFFRVLDGTVQAKGNAVAAVAPTVPA